MKSFVRGINQKAMKKNFRFFSWLRLLTISFVSVFVSICPAKIHAGHAMGAEIRYEYLTGNDYIFELIVYHPCQYGSLSEYINFNSPQCNLSFYVLLTNIIIDTVPDTLNGVTSCLPGGTKPVWLRCIYRDTVTMPSDCDDWIIYRDRCCRNINISNIPGHTNSYVYALLDNLGQDNNSARMDPLFHPFAYLYQPSFQSFHAVDADGDSLVYSLAQPLSGVNSTIPYTGSFTVSNPLSAFTGTIKLDSLGYFHYWPNQVQNSVIVVKIREYRNGVVIGETMRDIMIGTSIGSSVLPPANGNLLCGQSYSDVNSNCNYDAGIDHPVCNTLMYFIGPSGAYYSFTDSTGKYSIFPFPGNWTVFAIDNNPYFDLDCPATFPIQFQLNVKPGDTICGLDFGWESGGSICPLVYVNLTSSSFNFCDTANIHITVFNLGTAPIDSGSVDVALDSLALFLDPGIASVNSVIGNTINLGIPVLLPGQSVTTFFHAATSCNLKNVGMPVIMKSYAYPDTCCLPPSPGWDGSDLQVTGACINDSLACFTVKNSGAPGSGNMASPFSYSMYNNFGTTVQSGTLQLNGGTTKTYCYASGGEFVWFDVKQTPGQVFDFHANDFVMGCDTTSMGLFYIDHAGWDDEEPWVDWHVSSLQAPYDPNNKEAEPEGMTGTYHYISETQDIDYTIHFQNTGTDTAIKVIIRDTLSPLLEPYEVIPGASSHNCIFSFEGAGKLKFSFPSIHLPDSGADIEKSKGFITFHVNQKAGNMPGSILYNTASIYFDSNPAIVTNTVFHTIGIPEILSQSFPASEPESSVQFYPNPAREWGTVLFELDEYQNVSIELLDFSGKMLELVSDGYWSAGNHQVQVKTAGLAAGIYFLLIRTRDRAQVIKLLKANT